MNISFKILLIFIAFLSLNAGIYFYFKFLNGQEYGSYCYFWISQYSSFSTEDADHYYDK